MLAFIHLKNVSEYLKINKMVKRKHEETEEKTTADILKEGKNILLMFFNKKMFPLFKQSFIAFYIVNYYIKWGL